VRAFNRIFDRDDLTTPFPVNQIHKVIQRRGFPEPVGPVTKISPLASGAQARRPSAAIPTPHDPSGALRKDAHSTPVPRLVCKTSPDTARILGVKPKCGVSSRVQTSDGGLRSEGAEGHLGILFSSQRRRIRENDFSVNTERRRNSCDETQVRGLFGGGLGKEGGEGWIHRLKIRNQKPRIVWKNPFHEVSGERYLARSQEASSSGACSKSACATLSIPPVPAGKSPPAAKAHSGYSQNESASWAAFKANANFR